MSVRLSAKNLRALSSGPVSERRWRGKGRSAVTRSTAPSRRSTAPSTRRPKRRVGLRARSGASLRAMSMAPAHQRLPKSLVDWARYGNLPVQAAVQSVLINIRQQFAVQTSVSNAVNLFFYPGANDTIGFYTSGISGLALPDNTVINAGYSCLKNTMLTSLVTGAPPTCTEWRPTRLWVRLHNTTIFTSRAGGCLVTRPKGNWTTFSSGSVGPGQAVSQENLAALPETRFYDFSQMAGPTEYTIATFPTDLEGFSYFNTKAPDVGNGVATNWLSDLQTNGQKWAPLNFYIPPSTTNQQLVFEVCMSYDCKISEALASTSPMATLAAAPPIAPPHPYVASASAALSEGSSSVASMMTEAAAATALTGAGLGLNSMIRGAGRAFLANPELVLPLLG